MCSRPILIQNPVKPHVSAASSLQSPTARDLRKKLVDDGGRDPLLGSEAEPQAASPVDDEVVLGPFHASTLAQFNATLEAVYSL